MNTRITQFAFCFFFFMFSLSSSYGQRPTDAIESSFFKKSTSLINLIQEVSVSSLSTNEADKTTNNNFNIRLRGNYFVADQFGVVAGIHTQNQVTKFESSGSTTTNKNNYTLFEVGGIYGFQPEFLNNTPIAAQLTFGFGSADFSGFENGLFATEATLSSYHKISESGLYISPTIGYGFLNQSFKESDVSAVSNGFIAGVTLVKPFSCEEWLCALDENESPNELYLSGNNSLVFSQSGLFATGKTKIEEFDSEINNTNFDLRVADYHYVLDNFAVGASFSLGIDGTNIKSSESKTTTTTLTFMPMVRYNAPLEGALNHLFADAGVGFGSSNTKSVFMQNESTSKNGITEWEVGLGYNIPFTDRLAFSIQGGYSGRTVNDKDTDTKTNTGGFYALYGLNFSVIP